MLSTVTRGLIIAVACAALGATVALPSGPVSIGAAALGFVACVLGFMLWPWAVLPVGLVGGSVIAGAVTDRSVDGSMLIFIGVHAGIVVAGGLATLIRWVIGAATADQPRRTAADKPMLAIGLLLVLSAGFGLAIGNAADDVVFAAYQIGIIPGYFFLATYTLTTPQRLRNAQILYVMGAAVLAIIELAVPGQHGGLLSVLAIPPLLVAAGRAHGWRRLGLSALIVLFAVDVVLAGYRSMWLATGVALLILLAWGTAPMRRGIGAAAAAVCIFLTVVVPANEGIQSRAEWALSRFEDGSGYRAAETMVGLRAFAESPVFGGGLGQTTPQVYLPDFAFTDVGPIYHAFYVMVLANLGLIGCIVVALPFLRTIRIGLADRKSPALAFVALTCGFLVGAVFSGPSDGHWELGLLPAMVLLAQPIPLRRQDGCHDHTECHRAGGDVQTSPSFRRVPDHPAPKASAVRSTR